MNKINKDTSSPLSKTELEKRIYSSLPIICHFLEKINLKYFLSKHINNQRYVESLIGLIKSILIDSQALYFVSEWSEKFDQNLINSKNLSDDVIGRALDKLFDCDRASLSSSIVIEILKVFKISTEVFHNDSTSLKVFGQYKNQNKNAAQLKFGHSKDHRPDLRQLVYNLCVTRDGGIPIFFKLYDGNITDDTTHIETWQSIKGIIDRSNFIYVADSKLCTRENMDFIDKNQGSFITVLPRTRIESKNFVEMSYNNEIRWEELLRKKVARDKKEFEVFHVTTGAHRLEEGYRVYWYRSSEKLKRDKNYRENVIIETINDFNALADENRRKIKSVKSMTRKVQAIFEKRKCQKWIYCEIKINEIDEFKKENKGPPKSDSRYIKKIKKSTVLIYRMNQEGIDKSMLMDGVFPLVTNTNINAKETLLHYKYQPHIERRHHILKGELSVAPIHLKNNKRIESIMFIYFLSQMILCLIEREIKNGMLENKINELNILPESRPTKAPTWATINRTFEGVGHQDLTLNGEIIKSFSDELSPLQLKILEFLNIKSSVYN